MFCNQVNYADIYDPGNNIEHMKTRYIKESETKPSYYSYYEPYGHNCTKKKKFIKSINEDHELWSNELMNEDRCRKVNFHKSADFVLKGL